MSESLLFLLPSSSEERLLSKALKHRWNIPNPKIQVVPSWF